MKDGRSFFFLILAASLATIADRSIPYFTPIFAHLPKALARGMRLLPVAALGALLFPGVVKDFSSCWYAGLAGTASAFFLAWKKLPMVVPIVASIVVTYAVLAL